MTEGASNPDPRPLTIVHVMGYYAPGLGYQENFLPFEQAAAGHRVHIATGDRYMPHPSYDTVYRPRLGPRIVGTGRSVERGVTIHRLPVPFESERSNRPYLSGCAALIDEVGADVVHLHGVTSLCSLQVMLSGAARRRALVCDHHLCDFNLAPLIPLKRLYYAFMRTIIVPLVRKRVRAWLPINEDAQGVLREMLGIAGSNVHINRLGVDAATLGRNAAAGEAWRRAHGVAPNATLVVHAGRLEPRKALDVLIAAFASAFPRRKNAAVLALVGDGDAGYLACLRAQAEALGIRKQLILPGMQQHEALVGLFNAADAGAWPGDPSITLLEALACGLAVVISDPPGAEYTAGCPGAETISRRCVDELARALLRQVRTTKSARDEIAADCARRLGWSVIAAESVTLYRQAMLQPAEGA